MTAHPLPSSAALARWRLRFDFSDVLLTLASSALTVTFCLLVCDEAHHAFVLPVMLCGGLIGLDALVWLRGRVDAFDPIGVLGMIGVHFYFTAPLLHVLTGHWMSYVTPPEDWRPWLGAMAWLNVAGLLAYRFTRRWLCLAWPAAPSPTTWRLDGRRFSLVCGAAIALATAVQVGVYASFGGISGYMQAYSESAENFTGLGYVFILSESAPILAVFAAACWARAAPGRRTWLNVAAILLGFVVLKLFFGGLRGSRGHLIYGAFWALGVIHYQVRPLSRKLFVAGAAAGLAFMYAYGFYKEYGTDVFDVLHGAPVRAEAHDPAARTLPYVLLGDLARADSQAYLLYRISPECRQSRFRFTWGQTYLGAVSLLVPRSILAERPPNKLKAGTDAFFGYGVFESEMVSTFAYALAGEAMLNFGVVGGLLSFVVLAAVVVWARRWRARLDPRDARQLLAPFVASLAFMTLLWDSDVVLFYTVKESLVPALVVAASVRRVTRTAAGGEAAV